MCKESFCEDNQINNVNLVNNEIDLSESEQNSTVTIAQKIYRAVLITYIKGFANDQAQESFINPNMCIKIIDFVHLLKNKTGLPLEKADQLVHDWYKMPVQDTPIPAFKDRTKTVDEVIHHLEADCDLQALTID